ncbi:MAG: hypothetical protein SVP26_03145 [Chloroflexota bacterium]|nr:hypothetical protein [Chloroflexota bacterium]
MMNPMQYPAPGYAGVRPPAGWVPSIDEPDRTILRLIAVYDSESGHWVGLPLQALTEALVHAEQLHSVGKIDSRQGTTLTVPSGSAVGVYGTVKEIEVPADEVWFLSQVELVTPAQSGGIVLGNFRVSPWADEDHAAGQSFWATNQGAAGGGIYVAECYGCAPAFVALGDAIGAVLRLPPGAKLTLFGEVTTAALTADRTLTLNPYGWKGKRLLD